MPTSPTRGLVVAAGLAAATLLSGCASLETDDVSTVARAFEDASGDPEQRCELLAPATRAALESDESAPCADALDQIPLQGGTLEAVEVWSGNAQVRLSGDTVFLTETDAGWRVTAAACRPRGEAPYDCEVEGP
ncbi:hypothetical protein ACI79C_04485 [Geodermatophilus sp. SYSU D00697]